MAAPTNLVATAINDDSISLTWDAYTGASGYDIERDGSVIVTNHPTNSYTDTGLDPGTSYDYRVRAKLGVTEYTVLHDTFTDTSGTLLTAHTPDTDASGLGWVHVFGTAEIDTTGTKLYQADDIVACGSNGETSLRATFINWEVQYGGGSDEEPTIWLFTNNAGYSSTRILIKLGGTVSITDRAGAHLAGSPFTTSFAYGLQDVKVETNGVDFIALYRAPAGTQAWTLVCLCEDTDIATNADTSSGHVYFGIGAARDQYETHKLDEFKLEKAVVNPPLMSGGTITFDDGYVYHTFTTSGSLTPIADPVEVEYLVVAGGGGGGGSNSSGWGPGGGGAGGKREGTATIASALTVTLGGGGPGGSNFNGTVGTASSLGAISASGGGYGGGSSAAGGNGGSGGGSSQANAVGTGITGQGFDGGSGLSGSPYTGGGGGGASEAGESGNTGNGGDGEQWPAGSGTYYAGGGAGGAYGNGGSTIPGGLGGGADSPPGAAPSPATANTGGGGAGGTAIDSRTGSAGGSGITIVRYPVDYAWTGTGVEVLGWNGGADTGFVTTVDVPFPTAATILSGDLLVAIVGSNVAQDITATGWTVAATSTGRMRVLYRVANGSESGSQTFTKSVNYRSLGVMGHLRGGDLAVHASNATLTPPALSPEFAPVGLVLSFAHRALGTNNEGNLWTPSSGFTEQKYQNLSSSANAASMSVASGTDLTPGAWGYTGDSTTLSSGTIAVRLA